MRKITLGRTGLNVSAVGLGCLQLSRITKREAFRVIATAREHGINFLETSHGYRESERRIGAALQGKREGLILASKSGAADAKTFAADIDDSLKRLRTDYIDIYQFHGVDSRDKLDKIMSRSGAFRAATKALKQGKIGSIGITSHTLDLCLHFLRMDLFDSIQLPISLINTEVPRSGLLGEARRRKVGLLAMKPLGGGRLNNARLALGYIYRYPRVVPIVGMKTAEQVLQVARIASRPPRLGPRDYERIRHMRRTVGTTFCRACRYCEPCPKDISIFRVLYFPVYVKQMGAKAYVGEGVPDWLEKADECIECRKCESRCPFRLHIVEGLKANLAMARRLAHSMA